MLRVLILLMIIVPTIEIWGLITVGKWIGHVPTILLVIFTAVAGAWLAKKQGMQTIRLVQLQLSRGEIPGQAVMDGIAILVGGAVLLTPGFFTDALGLFLIFPYTRAIFKAWLIKWISKRIKNGQFIIIKR